MLVPPIFFCLLEVCEIEKSVLDHTSPFGLYEH